ncbi:MAG: hypothetical protein J7525_14085 [Roseofilum sp. SID3]|nr:hypothetical protein [Roseofilum sp. SID3]
MAIDLGFTCSQSPNGHGGLPYYRCVYSSGQAIDIHQGLSPDDYAELQALGPNPVLLLGDGTCTIPGGGGFFCMNYSDSYWDVFITFYWKNIFPILLSMVACRLILKYLRMVM